MNFNVLAPFALVALALSAGAQERPAAREFRKGIVFESTIENPKVFSAVEGAKRTLLAPAYEWEYGLRFYTREKWEKQGLSWEQFRRSAIEIADKLAETVKPEFVRDHRKVVKYAILEGKDPFLSSVLLSKKLHPVLEEKLGENIYVVIPERGTLYFFPVEGNTLDGFGASIVKKYKNSNSPVSIEVILFTSEGFRVVGELSDS